MGVLAHRLRADGEMVGEYTQPTKSGCSRARKGRIVLGINCSDGARCSFAGGCNVQPLQMQPNGEKFGAKGCMAKRSQAARVPHAKAQSRKEEFELCALAPWRLGVRFFVALGAPLVNFVVISFRSWRRNRAHRGRGTGRIVMRMMRH